MVYDEEKRILAYQNKKIKLGMNEARAMNLLIENKNTFCTLAELAIYCYSDANEENWKLFKNSTRQLIYNLKRKLKNDLIIETFYNVGYFLKYPVKREVLDNIHKQEIQAKIDKIEEEIQLKRKEQKKLREEL